LPMATRREPRKEMRVRIRIFSTDFDGKAFNENVFTVNASRAGAMVIEVRTRLNVGEIIGLAYGMASRSGRRFAGLKVSPFPPKIWLAWRG
jgi:hypothetical protein